MKSREQEAFQRNPAPDWLEHYRWGGSTEKFACPPCPCTCTSYRANTLCPPPRYVLESPPLPRQHQKPGSREALISLLAHEMVLLRYRLTCGNVCTEGYAADPFFSRLTAPSATVLSRCLHCSSSSMMDGAVEMVEFANAPQICIDE